MKARSNSFQTIASYNYRISGVCTQNFKIKFFQVKGLLTGNQQFAKYQFLRILLLDVT